MPFTTTDWTTSPKKLKQLVSKKRGHLQKKSPLKSKESFQKKDQEQQELLGF